MPEGNVQGVLFIGDPHLASRAVGFRKDDYGRAVLEKVKWCLALAQSQSLIPVFLGDMFHHPRDNANWLVGELLEHYSRQLVLGIYGNHDCREDALGQDDSLDLLVSAGHFRLLTPTHPWRMSVDDQQVAICGIPWRQKLDFDLPWLPEDDYRILITHHDLNFPGYESSSYFRPKEIEGLDLVVNGHIHRSLGETSTGRTTWVNPGNISRVARSDSFRAFVPRVLLLSRREGEWQRSYVDVPHQPFDDVFYEAVIGAEAETLQSDFVKGLAELQALKTESGAGLQAFLDLNVDQFAVDVRQEVMLLASQVLSSKPLPSGEVE